MIRRRFVNLVAENNSTGALSLHRLDVAKNLFYPSTAKAEAANATAKENNNGGGSKPPRIRSLRRLPPLSLCFDLLSPPCWCSWDSQRQLPDDDMFVLVNPHSSEGKILQACGEDGYALLHDVDSGSTTTMPSIEHTTLGYGTIVFTSIAGTGAGAGARAGAGKEEEGGGSLYVLAKDHWYHSFQVLDLSQHPHMWQHLPLPPFAGESSANIIIESFTVVDGGRTICASTDTKGTYCFDMRSHEWWKAGDWVLPFEGRAEYVPELETWFGIKRYAQDHRLCASSDLAAAIEALREPKLQHDWKYLDMLPLETEYIELKGRLRGVVLRRSRYWSAFAGDLLSLGGGRFCIATVIRDEQQISCNDEPTTKAEFIVLSGVEVVRDDEGGGLRMVNHKSKRYTFTNDKIRWVL